MGWWNVQGTGDTIGDGPLDSLGSAVSSVVAQYQTALGRRPTRAEWEALVLAVLGAEEPDARALDDGVPVRVRIDVDGRRPRACP